jgi:hypothetical protein
MIPQPPFPPDPGELRETLFPQTSRYHGLQVLKTRISGGREVAFVERRFLPLHEFLDVVEEHTVVEGDRIDNIAATYLGDPELFWRVCDGNHELDPAALTTVEVRKLKITLQPRTSGNSDV